MSPTPQIKIKAAGSRYMVVEEFEYGGVVVEKGFVSDGASVPKSCWQITYPPYHPKVITAAIVHDKCYATGALSREAADKLFRDMLTLNRANDNKIALMYKAIRRFGEKYYKGADYETKN